MTEPATAARTKPPKVTRGRRKLPAASQRPRHRMNAEDREELILRAATAYFAEQGLGAGTIELARRIGITQPLLYKYFPTKDALIERVYDRLIPKNWNPNWELVLIDQSTPVRQRLKTFYVDYVENVLTYEHVRLFLFSGLSRSEFNARYYAVLSKRIFEVIARAMRQEFGIVKKSRSVAKQELEIVQSLHAVIYHLAYRRFVHGESIDNLAELVERKVDFYLDGACDHFRKLADPPEAKKARPR